MVSPQKILFVEVESEDDSLFLEKYPNVLLDSEKLSLLNVEKYADVEVLCVFIYSDVSAEVIAKMPNLKLIITRSVGYDHIDLKASRTRDILVCNVPNYGSHVIAEHVFALLLASIRRIKEGDDRVEHDSFDFQGLRGIALKGKKMGIIGTGKIGKNVARIASLGFLMDVFAYDVCPDSDAARECHFQYVPLEHIWKECDCITLHVPLLPSTEHMINDSTIAQMKEGVVLINTARGGVIDTQALVRGITSGKIFRAALDVLEHEKNITENKGLISLPQVIITPHTAFYADDSVKKMYEESFVSLDQYLHGQKMKYQVVGE